MSLSVGSRKEAGLEELDITDPSESMEEKAGNRHDETNQNDSQLSTDSATLEDSNEQSKKSTQPDSRPPTSPPPTPTPTHTS